MRDQEPLDVFTLKQEVPLAILYAHWDNFEIPSDEEIAPFLLTGEVLDLLLLRRETGGVYGTARS